MLLAKSSLLCGVATASEKYLVDGVRGEKCKGGWDWPASGPTTDAERDLCCGGVCGRNDAFEQGGSLIGVPT